MSITQYLPTVNACLNALAGTFLFFGWLAIKGGRRKAHQWLMTTAFACSILFLGSYLTYHYLKAGLVTRYTGEGLARIVYFFILGTHTPLAALIVPFSVAALWFAWKKDFLRHVKITRWLFPVWIYVSLTGVLIYLMLYVWPAG